MPAATPIGPAISALEFYRKFTGQSVEVHYALIDGVNDTIGNAHELVYMLRNRDIPVKLLRYNERKAVDAKASEDRIVQYFMRELKFNDIKCEYYVPPGKSVGASCGELLMHYYLKYNLIDSYKDNQ
jgi:23S rRNA (adenine2503-C2)-methyltransferase